MFVRVTVHLFAFGLDLHISSEMQQCQLCILSKTPSFRANLDRETIKVPDSLTKYVG